MAEQKKNPAQPTQVPDSRPAPTQDKSIGERVQKNDVTNTRPAPDRNTGTGKTKQNG